MPVSRRAVGAPAVNAVKPEPFRKFRRYSDAHTRPKRTSFSRDLPTWPPHSLPLIAPAASAESMSKGRFLLMNYTWVLNAESVGAGSFRLDY